MILRLCKCGATPNFSERAAGLVQIVQVVCQCGRHGTTLMFTQERDRERMKQAAADGWNLAD